MARNDGFLVRVPPDLLAAIDEVRGERSRPEFARKCMERVVAGERAAKVKRPAREGLPVKSDLTRTEVEPRFKK